MTILDLTVGTCTDSLKIKKNNVFYVTQSLNIQMNITLIWLQITYMYMWQQITWFLI